MPESSFLFTVCQQGAELALKAELMREHPELRLAFSRPGFVTFKHLEAPIPADFQLRSVFARAWGTSGHAYRVQPAGDLPAGGAKPLIGRNEALAEIVQLGRTLNVERPGPKDRRVVLHAFERERGEHAEPAPPETPKVEPEPLARELAATLRALEPELFFPQTHLPKLGEPVLDLVVVEDLEWWTGWHIHSAAHSVHPGGLVPLTLPKDAPSRAWLKLEEMLRWSKAPLEKGDVAVEIGSAPGGAAMALLDRGLTVIGIDPGKMALPAEHDRRFTHLRKAASGVVARDLPERVDWILADINSEPSDALREVERIVKMVQGSVLGVVLTLKLNRWAIAEQIPELLGRIERMGMKSVRATQLPSHRREFGVIGLTGRGATRPKIEHPGA